MPPATFKSMIKQGFQAVPGLRRTVRVLRQTGAPSYDTATGKVSRSEEVITLSVIFTRFHERQIDEGTVLRTDRVMLIAGKDLAAGQIPDTNWRVEDTASGEKWNVQMDGIRRIPPVEDANVAMWRLHLRRT